MFPLASPGPAYWFNAAGEDAAAATAESKDDGAAPPSVPVKHVVCAEYVWLDAWQVARSKTKCMYNIKPGTTVTLADLGEWNFDGSSTGQAPGEDSEVILVPKVVYPDPFRGAPHVLVLCENYTPKGKPIPSNTRAIAVQVFDAAPKEEPWFGLEQEYIMFKKGAPLGWPTDSEARNLLGPTSSLGYVAPQGPYYCGSGADVAFGRMVCDEHMRMCTKAGLKLTGTNAEVLPGQWEFQILGGGIAAADGLVMARYIMNRVGEKYGVVVSLHPKPLGGDWNGSGCHTNFSTKNMREAPDGFKKYIIPAIERLGRRHAAHIVNYGADNHLRLTGKHETQRMDTFSWGVASRKASIRVGNDTAKNGRGYMEDRRPASNVDPYLCTAMIFDTAVLNGKFASKFPGPVKKLAVGSEGFSSEDGGSEGYASEGSEGGRSYRLGRGAGAAKGPMSPRGSGKQAGCSVIM